MNLTPTKRNLLTNTGAQIFARLFSSSLSFLLSLILIRHFNIAFYGDFVKVTALLFFNNTFVDLGINAIVVRRLTNLSSSHQHKLLHRLLSLRLWLALITVILTLIWLFLFQPSNYPSSLRWAYLIGSFSVFAFAFHLSAIAQFQFKLTYFKSALANSLGSLSFFLTTLFLFFFPANLNLLLLSFSFGYLVTALISFIFSYSTFKHFRLFSFQSASKLLYLSTWISLSFLFSAFANKLDVLIASFFRPASEIGQYGFAYKIFDLLVAIPSFLMNAVYPILLKTKRSKQHLTLKVGLSLFLFSLFLSLIFFVAAPLILYLKPNLDLAVRVLRILLFSLPLFYLTPPLMWHLVALRQEKKLTFIYAFATAINLILNLIFVPQYGVIASAFITLVTELTIFLGLAKLFSVTIDDN